MNVVHERIASRSIHSILSYTRYKRLKHITKFNSNFDSFFFRQIDLSNSMPKCFCVIMSTKNWFDAKSFIYKPNRSAFLIFFCFIHSFIPFRLFVYSFCSECRKFRGSDLRIRFSYFKSPQIIHIISLVFSNFIVIIIMNVAFRFFFFIVDFIVRERRENLVSNSKTENAIVTCEM